MVMVVGVIAVVDRRFGRSDSCDYIRMAVEMKHLRKGSNMRTIDKDATIEALQRAANANIAEPVGNGIYRYTDDFKGLTHAVSIVEDMPEAQLDAIPVEWIQKYADDWEDMSYAYDNPILGMLEDWRREQDGNT